MVARSMVVLVGFLTFACAARAEPRITYDTEAAYDTNYLSDTSNIAAFSMRSTLGFEGEIEREGTKFGYSFNHQEVLVPRYRFLDEHNSWVNFSLSQKVNDRLEWQAQMRGTRSDAGDLADPGFEELVPYRQLDHKLDFSASATLAALGGKNTLSGSYTSLLRGKGKFDSELVPTQRTDANEALLTLKAEHIRPLLGGEAGTTIAYNSTHIPSDQQDLYLRFPATNLRGSVAYGRQIGNRLTVLADVGITTLRGSEIGDSVKRTRPYLRAEAELKISDNIALAAGYSQDYAIYDLDDEIAEFQRRWKMVLRTSLTEKIGLDVALERARKEWVFYENETTERRLVATLAVAAGKGRKLELEFSRLLHDSWTPSEIYQGTSISTRFSGTF